MKHKIDRSCRINVYRTHRLTPHSWTFPIESSHGEASTDCNLTGGLSSVKNGNAVSSRVKTK